MATNITNQQIDNAIPDKGSSTPHAEQPNRKLTNGILKAIAAETNALGTAATKNVGTDTGDVMEVGEFGLGRDRTSTATDFNSVSYPSGLSRLSPSSASAVNGPPRGTGTSNVVNSFTNPNYGFQIGGRAVGFALQFRHVEAGVWSPWREFIHTGNILTGTGQSTSFPMTQKATTDAINGISDERDKTAINEIGLGLEVIENINTFSFKLNKRDWYRREAAKELIEVEEDGKVTIQEKINDEILNSPLSDFEENDGSLKRDDVYTGFVAQDLKETLESLDLGHLGIVKNYSEEYEGGEDRFYIEHLALLPFLVNSIKQLSARVKELEDAAE